MSCLISRKEYCYSATSDVEIPDFVGMESSVTLDFTQEEQNDSLSVKLVVSPEKDKIDTLLMLCSLNPRPHSSLQS